jgi:hypothetical protein
VIAEERHVMGPRGDDAKFGVEQYGLHSRRAEVDPEE